MCEFCILTRYYSGGSGDSRESGDNGESGDSSKFGDSGDSGTTAREKNIARGTADTGYCFIT